MGRPSRARQDTTCRVSSFGYHSELWYNLGDLKYAKIQVLVFKSVFWISQHWFEKCPSRLHLLFDSALSGIKSIRLSLLKCKMQLLQNESQQSASFRTVLIGIDSGRGDWGHHHCANSCNDLMLIAIAPVEATPMTRLSAQRVKQPCSRASARSDKSPSHKAASSWAGGFGLTAGTPSFAMA